MRSRESDADDAHSIEEELYDWYIQDAEQIEEADDEPKVGRPKISPAWSRILSLHRPELTVVQPYDLGKDLLFNSAIVKSLEEPDESTILFWPKAYYPGLAGWDMEVHRLEVEQMRDYGQRVSAIRVSII